MSILKVARMGHPVLRTKARAFERAEIKSAVVQKLIDDMIETMQEYHGVGLAAPQVHEGFRVFVAALDDGDEAGPSAPLAIIRTNPLIVHGMMRLPNSETGVSISAMPMRRKSNSIAMPRKRHSDSTWTDSTPGYMYMDSRSDVLAAVS